MKSKKNKTKMSEQFKDRQFTLNWTMDSNNKNNCYIKHDMKGDPWIDLALFMEAVAVLALNCTKSGIVNYKAEEFSNYISDYIKNAIVDYFTEEEKINTNGVLH